MKKTQSLKLMLLGLFALVSMSALAQDEARSYVASKGVIYDITGDEAIVVGVNQLVATSKKIDILDEVGTPAKKVTSFAEGWANSGKVFANNPEGEIPASQVEPLDPAADGSVTIQETQGSATVTTQTFPTIDATEIEGLELNIFATGMEAISREDIAGLQLRLFGLGKYCGIKAIPDYFFANATTSLTSEGQYYQNLTDQQKANIKSFEAQIATRENDIRLLNEKYGIPTDAKTFYENLYNNLDARIAKFNAVILTSAEFETVGLKTYWKSGDATLAGEDSWNTQQKAAWAAYIEAWKALKNEGEVDDTDKFDYTTKWEKLKNQRNEAADGIDDAQAKIDALDAQVKTKQGEIKYLENKIKEAEDWIAENQKRIDANTVWTLGDNNETLEVVNIYDENLESIGKCAFANCVKAEFSFGKTAAADKFPATLVKIGEQAFLNTQFANADFSIAADPKLEVAGDAFKGTPLETLKLKGTTSDKINGALIRDIVSSLLKTADDFEYADACNNKLTGSVQNTLATVTLPETLAPSINAFTFQNCIKLTEIEIPATVKNINQHAFDGCVALATITFAAAESQLVKIEQYAFNLTAATTFDLSTQLNLATIGDYAFANNCALTTVNLPDDKDMLPSAQAPLDELKKHTFWNDSKLATVTFNGKMWKLPNELFYTNVLADLDLSKTNVQVLNNLFNAGTNTPMTDELGNIITLKDEDGEDVLVDGKKVTVYLDKVNTTLESVTLPDGLLFINHFALAGLQNDKFTTLDIPSSVIMTGVGAFRNSSKLRSINFADTQIDAFERGTFEQCLALETVLLTSEWGMREEPGFVMNQANRRNYALKFDPTNNGLKTNLKKLGADFDALTTMVVRPIDGGQPVLPGALGEDPYYQMMYGAVYGFDDVWFDGRPNHEKVRLIVTQYDYQTLTKAGWGSGYFDEAYKAKYPSEDGESEVEMTVTGWVGAYSILVGQENTIELTTIGNYNWATFSSSHGAWIKAEDGVVVYSAYQDGNNVILYPAKIKNGHYKIGGYNPTATSRIYAENYYYGDATYTQAADRACAAVIRTSGNKTKINYIAQYNPEPHAIPEGMTSPAETHIAPRYQSTLDAENCLQILDENVYPSTNTNWYKFGVYDGEVNFWYISSGVLPKGKIAMNAEGVNGLSRLNLIIVEPNEATAVQGVKDYMDGIKSGAIYNLQGVKVTAPVKGQMYIQNGAKFIQK